MNEDERVCSRCGRILDESESTEYEGEYICEDCLNDEFVYCKHCGELIPTDESCTTENGDYLCQDCCDDLCSVCDHCGENVYTNEAISDDNILLCEHCFDNHYHRCENCGCIIHDDSTCWHVELPYCESCHEEIEDDEVIESYSYKPDPEFYGDSSDNRYFGVELEVDEGGKYDENAEKILNIANRVNWHAYIKSDGSLDDGFEIVSHPMTLQYHTVSMPWKEIMKEAVDMRYKSHDTRTCGLHVHVNRNTFGTNQSEQEEKIAKVIFFMEKHWNELFIFSRRTKYNIDRWAARFGYEKTGKEIMDKAKEGYNSYTALNIRNYSTIEFRIFRGTLKYNTFIATLQLVNKICNVAISLTEEEIDAMSWSKFVSTVTEPELIQYLKERRLYVNEAIESEEM